MANKDDIPFGPRRVSGALKAAPELNWRTPKEKRVVKNPAPPIKGNVTLFIKGHAVITKTYDGRKVRARIIGEWAMEYGCDFSYVIRPHETNHIH